MDIKKDLLHMNKISSEKKQMNEEKEDFDKYCELHEEELLEKILEEARSSNLLDK